MNYDKILSRYFLTDGWHYNKLHKSIYNAKKKKLINIKKYIDNRYSDSESFKETIYRMYYNIDVRPVCKLCKNKVKFIGKCGIIFRNYCSSKCAAKSPETIKKKQESDRLKHNGKLGWNKNTPEKNKKRLQTINEKYGGMHAFADKVKQTLLKKYGVTTPLLNKEILKKRNKTTFEKFGKYNITQTEYYKVQSYNTKKKNHTFNSSNLENQSYILLQEKYNDVIHQYESDKYPFVCDFYIPSLDLYIECNYHWTHGGHPYNPNNIDDYNKYNDWLNKNTKYYNNAIITWTCRDVNKRKIANQNNIKYIEFWNINELKEWIKKGDS